MKIILTKDLAISGIRIIRFGKFADSRGYFTESYRKSDLWGHGELREFANAGVAQINESVSKKGVVRGLHFQWNPFMGKLVRTLSGRMIDIVLDIRPDSPTKGQAILHDMPAGIHEDWDEWIWVPPGFAHGNLFLEDTRIEYLCTGEYSPGCEAGIAPFAQDIDWTPAETSLRAIFDSFRDTAILSEKDAAAPGVEQWFADPRSAVFTHLRG